MTVFYGHIIQNPGCAKCKHYTLKWKNEQRKHLCLIGTQENHWLEGSTVGEGDPEVKNENCSCSDFEVKDD